MGVSFVHGDLLETKGVDEIIHQVNCLCTEAHGLSKQITLKFPWGDTYSKRRREGRRNLAIADDRGIPGTIRVFEASNPLQPNIICFLSQWDFGTKDQSHRNIPPYNDTSENRLKWFCHCLDHLKTLDIKSVGIPYRIGCGLGGGNWMLYWNAIDKFTERTNINIIIVIPNFK